jgi:glycosyltransferase involved in cell wall biosynthesis
MKVAMVTSSLSRAGAGVTAAVEALSCAVLDTGVNVRVFGLDDTAPSMSDRESWNGAPAVAFPIVGPRAFGYAPEMVKSLIAWSPDVVHVHGIWMHPSRSVLQWARATGRPYMITPHGMLAPIALKFSPLKKKLSLVLFQKESFDAACCLHATCDAEYNEIRRFGLRRPVAIIPNGITVADLPLRKEWGQRRRVLSLGRIHPKKGLHRLIRAWALVEDYYPDWWLDIVGPSENDHAAELGRLVCQLGLRRVSIAGPVYGRKKDELMSNADVFVLPTFSENFALTVAESLGCGTPVISTKGAPWRGLEDNACGWWVDHGVEPMVAALREAMSMSVERRRSMGMRGRAWMERDFSWASVAQQATEVYRWMHRKSKAPLCVHLG